MMVVSWVQELSSMSIHVALRHATTYRFDRPVSLSPHSIRLRPAPHCRAQVLGYSLRVSPQPHFLNWLQDPQSNHVARLVFPEKATEFRVEVDLVVEMAVYNPFDFFLEKEAETYPFTYDPILVHELAPFRQVLPATSRLREYVAAMHQKHGEKETAPRTIDFLVALNRAVNQEVRYLIRLEPGVQTPEETLARGSGSCRDSAWLLCQMLRHLGIAARFVSGYLIQLKPDEVPLDGPAGASEDFTDLHAWCEAYLPGAGWIGLDPTSGLLAGEGHIPLAATPDPGSAAPISGMTDKCEVEFDFEMSVTRIQESPRVTKPYTEHQWAAIESLGHRIDAQLGEDDVRLTMGGEPTFVSIDDMEGAEWNMEAVGPTKRLLASDLLRRLRGRFAPGGLLFHGQGKWYPGEMLPRWALAVYWRRDGQPIWRDPALLADDAQSYGHDEKDARRFGLALALALGVDPRFLMQGHEDAFYYLWKERRLPVNVDPFESNLKDPLERERLARIFGQGLDKIIGYALPLRRQRVEGHAVWESGPWFLRDERLYLIPGDSPMGYRLPLDSLPWVSEADFPWVHPPDPSHDREALPPQFFSRVNYLRAASGGIDSYLADMEASGRWTGPESRIPGPQESAAWLTRTAMCFEAREGRLHVFMPPVADTEDYLDLIAAIEDTAAALHLPVIIEGTPPPYDARLRVIKVTPDPGVIEVNLQPAYDWKELVHNTTTLYEEARQSRLGTEKYLIDGRHTGTGGGNHIVIGGETPAHSPLLRRPDLLRSLVAFWHNHPSLSYLFSGLFIGPTSQHPRVDEARLDSLAELELAFRQVPDHGQVPPWLVDRLFRNLLVDSTGNTHRTEFCIDKLYSPDSSTGRLGLLEMRGFEMPPHARMSLAQHLLLRAAIARFWRQPYNQELVRWGTGLHDRFMLPHFVWSDFCDVLEDMQEHGFPLSEEWFAPHFEFRFPRIGDHSLWNLWLEFRTALEPWHVLGEESAAGATSRHVDSSLERLQVKVRGLVPGRHVLACNGRALPLHPTGTVGEFVAGVRYRAWQPPRCLQPTIGVHSPLVFDLLDSWSGRSLGGCQYHVSHPGGRGYDTFPVNAYEAEARRLSRFFPMGHSPGPVTVPKVSIDRDFPFTLDLRKA